MTADYNVTERRLRIVIALGFVWMVAIGGRLVWLQVGQHQLLRNQAERQHQVTIEVSPKRGVIYDRNGHELARSVEVQSLYVSPARIADKESAALKLSKLLDIDRTAFLKRLTGGYPLTVVKRKLSEKEVESVKQLGLEGLSFFTEMKRVYVNGSTAAHVVGFVDIDEKGLGGIEQSLDSTIRGRGGRVVVNVDAFQTPYSHSVEDLSPGSNVKLTIDTMIQHDAEKALAQAVRATQARGGSVVVIRPSTGEILALANQPVFDPNRITESTQAQRTNRAVEVAFEPGSIFKIVGYAGALEEGLINPATRIDCGTSEVEIANRLIRDGHTGLLSAARALEKSSNVAAIKIVQKLGAKRMARYISDFGFGRRTGVELPGESNGIVRDVSRWRTSSLAAIPVGYEVAVTALQAAAAFACVANGGIWVQPHLVNGVAGQGETEVEHQGESRRVIDRETAEDLKMMLEGVVIRGTGTRAQVGGYRVAGKTGTAKKIDQATGRYSENRYIASFAGFAPLDNPEVACIVSIDEPKGVHSGRDVAAPVFARVVASALQVLGVPPEADSESDMMASEFRYYDIPRTIVRAEPELTETFSSVTDETEGDGSGMARGRQGGKVVVPDLIGRGMREAVVLCGANGLKIKASGEGIITQQSPPPGTRTPEGAVCYVILANRIGRGIVDETAVSSRRTKAQTGFESR